MNNIIQNQRKERDELLARPYLVRKSNTDTLHISTSTTTFYCLVGMRNL